MWCVFRCVKRVLSIDVFFVIFMASGSEIACPFLSLFFSGNAVFPFFSIFRPSPDSWVYFVFPKRVIYLLGPLRGT